MKRLARFILLALFMVHSAWFIAGAAVPRLINYQGRLTDSAGVPLNGTYNITFRIYDAESAGNLLWSETHSAAVIQKGIFHVMLGSVSSLGLAFDKPYWLEIKVGSDAPMAPRQQITSAGYAVRAEKAESLAIDAQQGDTLYFNGTNWVKLSGGTTGQYLGTNGSSANPAWSEVGMIPRGMAAYSTPGTYTWVKPANVNKVYVKVWGGGGGGSRPDSYGRGGGGGGGSGGYSEGIINVSGSVNVTVGIGGAQESNGGISSFANIIANGGNGASATKYGGSGGGASGGSINLTGNSGNNGGDQVGGMGGSSPFGSSGGGGVTTGIGGDGQKPGGGGGGGGIVFLETTNSYAYGSGGSGANGLVIVYY